MVLNPCTYCETLSQYDIKGTAMIVWTTSKATGTGKKLSKCISVTHPLLCMIHPT